MQVHYSRRPIVSVITSKVTQRSQTTLPPAVRTVLGLQAGERVGYVIEGNEIRLVNASAVEHHDPVLDMFLVFLGRDLAEHPDKILALPALLVERARAISAGVAIDHEAPIDGDVAI